MFATRSGTMVCVSSVATKKIAPTRANKLARVILASTISSRRLNNASDVTLLGSRPSWIRIFATRKLSAAVSRIRSSIVDRSALLKFIESSGRLGGAKRFSDSNEGLGQRPIRYEEETSVGMAPARQAVVGGVSPGAARGSLYAAIMTDRGWSSRIPTILSASFDIRRVCSRARYRTIASRL